jgi:pilus assembly protein Flp/PilA
MSVRIGSTWSGFGSQKLSRAKPQRLMSLRFKSGHRAPRSFRKLYGDDSGTTAIEYALIAAGLSIAIVGIISTLGTQITTVFYDKLTTLF